MSADGSASHVFIVDKLEWRRKRKAHELAAWFKMSGSTPAQGTRQAGDPPVFTRSVPMRAGRCSLWRNCSAWGANTCDHREHVCVRENSLHCGADFYTFKLKQWISYELSLILKNKFKKEGNPTPPGGHSELRAPYERRTPGGGGATRGLADVS